MKIIKVGLMRKYKKLKKNMKCETKIIRIKIMKGRIDKEITQLLIIFLIKMLERKDKEIH
jgi:hypothetical protein